MAFSQQYLDYLYEFHIMRDYFECHEIMENLWQKMPYYPEKTHAEIALLQVAVGLYHWRRHNFSGAKSLFKHVRDNFDHFQDELNALYDIDAYALFEDVCDIEYMIETEQEYYDYCLPLNKRILTEYIAEFELSLHTWNAPSDLDNEKLINRHLFKNVKEDQVKIYRFIGTDNKMFQDVLSIRNEVFAIEQGYDPLLDPDEIDNEAVQFILYDGNKPVSVGRLFQNNGKYQIGRMATRKDYRGKGFAQSILGKILEFAKFQDYHNHVVAHAQVQALPLYIKSGFMMEGEQYLEEGQPHQTVIFELL